MAQDVEAVSLEMTTGKLLPIPMRHALSAAVGLLMLCGCVSTKPDGDKPKTDQASTVSPLEDVAAAGQQHAAGQQAQPGYVDPMLAAAGSARGAQTVAPQPTPQGAPGYGGSAQIGGLATQPTGIAAGSQSIFSSPASFAASASPQAQGALDTVPAYAPARKIAPALNSVYSAPQAHQPMPQNPTQQQASPVPVQEQSFVAPTAGDPAQAKAVAAVAPLPGDKHGQGGRSPGLPENLPMAAALFAGAPKKRSTALPPPTTFGTASLHAGRAIRDAYDETHLDDDDKPAGLMKLASMSGLTRVAPNGLVLQTSQVEVGCFKPELVRRIREVETHYGRPAIVTSGYRPPKGVTQGSKHYTCEAADIQVKGVSKWELATYLRSLPDRGGVGTYCHTESVHMDVGEPRDWNWPCRKMAIPS